MSRRPILLLFIICLGWTIAGCQDDQSSGRTPAKPSSPQATNGTANGELFDELKGWQLAFLEKRPEDDQPGLFVADVGGGNVWRVDALPGDKQTPNWSPDGERIAFRWSLRSELDTRLAVIDADGRNFVDLSKVTGLRGWSPSWSPDGKQLVTAATPRAGVPNSLYIMNADGSHVHRITKPGREAQYASWSPDGDWIAFTFVIHGGFDLFKIRPDGSNLTALTNDGASGTSNWPMWSPDSAQIAYGREEVLWIMNADGSDKRLVTELARPGRRPHD